MVTVRRHRTWHRRHDQIAKPHGAIMNADTPEETDLEDRWPQEGDRLFIETNGACDAHVVRAPKERRFRMPRGYKRAGDILIEQAGSDLIDRRNTIYPAL